MTRPRDKNRHKNKKIDERGSGILLHISSLSSSYGVGDLGPAAYRFADFLSQTKQSCWQILPLNPTDPLYGNSPYSSISAFAGNTLFISPDLLLEEGLLSIKDLKHVPSFPKAYCDFPRAIRYKNKLLERAYQNFNQRGNGWESFEAFCSENSSWLEDFSLFAVLKEHFVGMAWNQWPKGLRNRNLKPLEEIRRKFHNQIEREKFRQYLFYRQWHSLKDYCRKKGINLFGDLAIYVRFNSADVWANPGLFKLDREKKPAFVSGVPPDQFIKRGQLWGNPVYRWNVLKKTGYQWWIERLAHNLKLFDVIRVDHFRGLVAYWQIPAKEKTAVRGKWVKAPVNDFLNTLNRKFPYLPIVVEDLGFITPDVRDVMERFNLAGMKILLFAFGEDDTANDHLPHAHEKHFLVYTGTHDNNTVRGWFESEASSGDKRRLFRYLGRRAPLKEIHWELIRLAMMSAAGLAILPMQDVLGLGREARMNRPSIARGNWKWRLQPGQVTASVSKRLLAMTKTYGRD